MLRFNNVINLVCLLFSFNIDFIKSGTVGFRLPTGQSNLFLKQNNVHHKSATKSRATKERRFWLSELMAMLDNVFIPSTATKYYAR
jgi:hypothetical protein